MSETYKNEEDEEVQTSEKLEADPATKEASLPDYHPCILVDVPKTCHAEAKLREVLEGSSDTMEEAMAPPHQRT